jgi:hypothetical protein
VTKRVIDEKGARYVNFAARAAIVQGLKLAIEAREKAEAAHVGRPTDDRVTVFARE